MSVLARRLVLRALARERGRALLALLAVALGVGVFLSIRLANRAAVASFEGFAQGVGQGSDLLIQADAGPMREEQLRALAPLREDAWMRPILEGSFASAEGHPMGPGERMRSPGESFQLLGVDLVGLGGSAEPTETAPQAQKPQPPQPQGPATLYATIQDPQAVMVSRAFAISERLRPGAALDGFVDGRPARLKVAGILPEAPNRPALQRNLLVMDLPAAQALLHREGQLDRVELGFRTGVDAAALEARVRAMLPPGLSLEAPEQRASSGRTMSAAFRFNLTILSLIALAVGAYLLFQTFDAAVTRRRETWATLRALGCPPAQVMRLVLLEAFLLGGLGSFLGVGLGYAMAQGAVGAVSRTMDALYGASAAHRAALIPGETLAAFTLGLLACLLAAWLPARRAASTPPVQLLARGAETRPMAWRGIGLLGIALTALGLLLAYGPKPPPGVAWHAYLGALLLTLGGSFASVALLPLLGLPGLGATRWSRRLALRPLLRPTGRHGFAAAALAVAIGMATGMGVMVQSFEGTVQSWIGTSLKADLYLGPRGSTGPSTHHRLDAALAEELAADAAVESVDRFQVLPILFRGQPTYLGAGEFGLRHRQRQFVMAQGGPATQVLSAIHAAGAADPGALCSETFSRRFGARLGDALELPTPAGPRRATLRGIYADYGNERGSILLDRPVFLDWFHDDRLANLALYLKPGQSAPEVAERLGRAHPGLLIRDNGALRLQVERIFHQTFALTYALELIGVAVALVGLVQSLVGLALARRGDLWTLRAMGASEGEIARVLLGEGLGVALAGLLGGLGLGLLLARILVDVVNPQVFGWTLAFTLPTAYLGGLFALGLLAALAALLPAARWGARLRADRAAEEGTA